MPATAYREVALLIADPGMQASKVAAILGIRAEAARRLTRAPGFITLLAK